MGSRLVGGHLSFSSQADCSRGFQLFISNDLFRTGSVTTSALLQHRFWATHWFESSPSSIAMLSPPSCSSVVDQLLAESANRWLSLRWEDGPVVPPKGVAYGTHLASYLHCTAHGELLGLNLQWFYTSPSNEVVRCHELLTGIEAPWLFRYETLKRYSPMLLSEDAVGYLGLPAHPIGERVDRMVEELRKFSHLHQFRFPGFPDDYNVTLRVGSEGRVTGLGNEQVWVRARRILSPTTFEGELLNQPLGCARNKGDLVRIAVVESPAGVILAAV